MSRLSKIAALWLCVAPLVPVAALAQSGAASITGLIVDETGGALPGVIITATSQASGVTYSATSNEAGNYTIPALLVGTYEVKAELSGFRTVTRSAGHARGAGGGQARLPHGRRRGAGDGRGHRRRADPADRVDRRRRGGLGEHRAVAAAERPQHRPAGAAAARHHHLQPARVHQHRQRQHEPAVRQRQPRADQQLHRRRPGCQRDHRQPRRLPAESRRRRRNRGRDQQLQRRHRQRRRRRRRHGDQVGQQRLPRQRLRVLPQQRPRREHLGEQPLRGGQTGTAAGHLRLLARRSGGP